MKREVLEGKIGLTRPIRSEGEVRSLRALFYYLLEDGPIKGSRDCWRRDGRISKRADHLSTKQRKRKRNF